MSPLSFLDRLTFGRIILVNVSFVKSRTLALGEDRGACLKLCHFWACLRLFRFGPHWGYVALGLIKAMLLWGDRHPTICINIHTCKILVMHEF